MLTVNLNSDPDVLLRMVRHHAREVEGVVLELLASITLVLGSDDEEWEVRQSRIGANSFSVRCKTHGEEFHFRGAGHGSHDVLVYDRWQHGKLITTITTREEARRFVKGLVTVPMLTP